MKGTVLDIVVLFVIMGVLFFSLLVGSEIYNRLVDSGSWPTTAVGNATRIGASSTLDVINYGHTFLLGGLIMALIISAVFIRTHPIFLVVSIIVLTIVIVVSAPITNAYMSFATSDVLSDDAARYDIATHTIGNLPIIAVVAGILIMIALYAKPRGEGL